MPKNFTNSDIFNSYIEIAEKSGLVSTADHADEAKKILDKNPRADSLTKEKISKLYNLEINAPNNMKYERNIMEVAHPKPVVIAPSYDKLNGLVENNNERQNIMLRIVDKRTNGLLTQHKYARDELVRSLVRIANFMDNKDEHELCALADECLSSLKKKAFELSDILGPEKKEWLSGSLRADVALAGLGVLLGAVAPVFVAGAGAGVLGGMAAGATDAAKLGLLLGPLIAHLAGSPTTFKSLSENIKAVSDELKELLKDKDIVGSKYENFLKDYIKHLDVLNKESLACFAEENKIVKLQNTIEEAPNKLNRKSIEDAMSSIEKHRNLFKAIADVKNDISKFREEHESIRDIALKSDYFGIEAFQKLESFFYPTFKHLSPVQEIYMDEESLLKAIDAFEKHSFTSEELALAAGDKIINAANKISKNLSTAGKATIESAIEEYKEKMQPEMGQVSSSILTAPPANDTEAKAKAASIKKMVDLIKNS